MTYTTLFMFVEGPTDARFVESVFIPMIQEDYSDVRVIEYASMPNRKLVQFLKAADHIPGNYWFLADLDDSNCVTHRKGVVRRRFGQTAADRCIVVKREIECWYLAGFVPRTSRRTRIRVPRDTEPLTKDQFSALRPRQFASNTDFMIEILKDFSVDRAKRRNASFKYATITIGA